MRKLVALSLGDLKNITRDAMLIVAIFAPIALAFFVKFTFPFVTKVAYEMFSLDLVEHYEFIMSFLILLSPFMVGVMAGLMLLDEQDDNILAYIAVTPLSKTNYLIYRLLSPMVISFILTIFIIVFTGLVQFKYQLLPIAFMVALEAPIMALFMGTFANNKVEGLAITKGAGIILFAPLVGYFITEKWNFIAGIFPTYWVSKIFVASYDSINNYIIYMIMGFIIHGLYIFFFLNKFNYKQT
ncbi:hypothetical protein [Bacillus wiedmannii]|uniref:hypothetical protein n=1 Tax=Bacillus wiedmannii TaxID=1890302 RepID=UPI000BF9DC27|nr:hypothetical protein [Bacillus wiedmannii]PGD97830.1 hypothetical protein COM48_07120 [Bacillus wiedmannii]PHG78279.1 hypothetical protein COI50_11010 [Bacillus wiedmannii]